MNSDREKKDCTHAGTVYEKKHLIKNIHIHFIFGVSLLW
jgi:hypothetical protein